MIDRLRHHLAQPVDAASSAAFRVLFGSVMLLSVLRFAAKGWVTEFYVAPAFHFAWPGFEWLKPWPAFFMYVHVALLAVAAGGVLLGFKYRLSAVVFFVAFTCLELFDQSYYLNHYYLVSLVALLCCVMPLHRVASLDASQRRRAGGAMLPPTVPRWVPWLLRGQLLLVYFYAGVAKLDGDWLVRAEPMSTWLQVHAASPLGPLLVTPGVAHILCWAGALFDLSIGALLLSPRSRGVAYGAVVGFHLATGLLFPIGIFPLLMVALTPIFFGFDWPRRVVRRLRGAPAGLDAGQVSPPSVPGSRPLAAQTSLLLLAYMTIQLVLPLRHWLYPGEVNWTEQGFRFAWRVMLIEKTGHVELRVEEGDRGRTWLVSPRRELTPLQYAMMSTQPDMIAQYARHTARRFAADGHPNVRVFADAWASLNGRPAQRLIDPGVDLAAGLPPIAGQRHLVPLVR